MFFETCMKEGKMHDFPQVDLCVDVNIPGEVPYEIRGIDEHSPGAGTDPVQSSPGRHPLQSPRTTEGYQGAGRHVA